MDVIRNVYSVKKGMYYITWLMCHLGKQSYSLVPTIDIDIIFCDDKQRNSCVLNPIIENNQW